MDRRRLEWLVILILLLLNLFLLAANWVGWAASDRERREIRVYAAGLLAERGIELVQDCPPPFRLERDLEAEGRFARRLLGNCPAEDLGGSIRSYRSEDGRLMLRGTGELDLSLSGRRVSDSGAERYLSTAGVTLFPLSETAAGEERSCLCGWNGVPIFNASLRFRFSGGLLREVTGTLPFTAGQPLEDQEGMDSVTALLRFLTLVKREGIICSRLEGLYPGYVMSVTVSGESVLTPVWRIVTDTTELYLDALTGANAGGRLLSAVSLPERIPLTELFFVPDSPFVGKFSEFLPGRNII